MNYRGRDGLLVLVAMVGGAGLVAMSACSAPDPWQVTFSERPKSQSDFTSGGPTTPVGDGGGSSSGEAGTGTDAGSSSGATITAFTGAAAFNAAGTANGDSLRPADHPNAGNPAGVNCMDCHSAAGAASAKFAFAGTVYNSAAGTAPIKGAEVRLVDAKGKELALIYSDAQGNFWSDIASVPGGSHVGARNATIKKEMVTALGTTDTGCQKAGCHVTGAAAQGRVYIQ